MLSTPSDTLALSEFPILEQSINEIDEALRHAAQARTLPHYTASQRAIITHFINDLLDLRLECRSC